MLKIFSRLLGERYEQKKQFENGLRAQYGPFLCNKPFLLSEPFYQNLIEAATPYLNNQIDALDVGCAMSRLVFEFEKIAKSSSGIDMSHQFIDFSIEIKQGIARGINFKVIGSNAQLYLGDILTAKIWPASSFGFLSCINVVDRVAHPKLLINRLYTLLKPGGVLLIVDPYDWSHSPAPKRDHVSDMKDLFDMNNWKIEREVKELVYEIPIGRTIVITYTCHMLILRKLHEARGIDVSRIVC